MLATSDRGHRSWNDAPSDAPCLCRSEAPAEKVTQFSPISTDAAMSEQDQIRAEYPEISAHLHPNDEEWAALESRRAALRVRCTHPNLGIGMLPGDFNQPVTLNNCPDCGYISELVL